MKKNILLLSLAALPLFFSCGDDAIELEPGPSVPANQFGFNAGTSFYWCTPALMAPCIEAFAPLAPAMLRFPSGIDANYYHLDGPGYGFRQSQTATSQDQADRDVSSDEPSSTTGGGGASADRSAFIDTRDTTHYPNGENVIGAFISLARASGSPLLFTCNMLDASYEENKIVLDSLIRGGVALAGIELGNEFYLPRYSYKYTDVQTYIDTAKYYTARLREDFPGVKIGAVAAPSEIMGEHEKFFEAYKDWNQALAAEDFYDAYCVHYYIKDTTRYCPGDSIAAAALDLLFTRYNQALQGDLAFWTGPAMDGFRTMFPGKKMWLTEWSTTNRYICFGNTQTSNLFFARFQNELATRHGDVVEMAHHHNWLGRGRHYPMLEPLEGGFGQRSSAPLFNMLQPIFLGRDTRVLPLSAALISEVPQGMVLYGYYQPATESKPARALAVVVNHNAQPHNLQFTSAQVKIEGKTFDLQNGVMKALYSDKLWASKGKPAFHSVQPVPLEAIQTSEGAFSGSASIPGYSVCLLIVE